MWVEVEHCMFGLKILWCGMEYCGGGDGTFVWCGVKHLVRWGNILCSGVEHFVGLGWIIVCDGVEQVWVRMEHYVGWGGTVRWCGKIMCEMG